MQCGHAVHHVLDAGAAPRARHIDAPAIVGGGETEFAVFARFSASLVGGEEPCGVRASPFSWTSRASLRW